MRFEEHCLECIAEFGNPYQEVHKWLDEFAGFKKYKMKHRQIRHHLEGIEKVKELFGERAGEAAKMHIISDLKEEGWTEDDPFPKNEVEYMKMGLY